MKQILNCDSINLIAFFNNYLSSISSAKSIDFYIGLLFYVHLFLGLLISICNWITYPCSFYLYKNKHDQYVFE